MRFAAPVAPSAFDGVAGVVDAELDGPTAMLTIDGPVGPAMSAAVDAGVLLRVAPAGDDLEDVFVSLYSHESANMPIEMR